MLLHELASFNHIFYLFEQNCQKERKRLPIPVHGIGWMAHLQDLDEIMNLNVIFLRKTPSDSQFIVFFGYKTTIFVVADRAGQR